MNPSKVILERSTCLVRVKLQEDLFESLQHWLTQTSRFLIKTEVKQTEVKWRPNKDQIIFEMPYIVKEDDQLVNNLAITRFVFFHTLNFGEVSWRPNNRHPFVSDSKLTFFDGFEIVLLTKFNVFSLF